MTFNNMFSADCIRSEFCQVVFVAMTVLTFWWRYFFIFLAENSFMEIFIHILFGRQMSPKRLFGRDVIFCFARCLVRASLVFFSEKFW